MYTNKWQGWIQFKGASKVVHIGHINEVLFSWKHFDGDRSGAKEFIFDALSSGTISYIAAATITGIQTGDFD